VGITSSHRLNEEGWGEHAPTQPRRELRVTIHWPRDQQTSKSASHEGALLLEIRSTNYHIETSRGTLAIGIFGIEIFEFMFLNIDRNSGAALVIQLDLIHDFDFNNFSKIHLISLVISRFLKLS
jgi:hypothetical protein